MKKRVIANIGILVSSAILLFACAASKEQYDIGMKLLPNLVRRACDKLKTWQKPILMRVKNTFDVGINSKLQKVLLILFLPEQPLSKKI
jgi:hypothetical protein